MVSARGVGFALVLGSSALLGRCHEQLPPSVSRVRSTAITFTHEDPGVILEVTPARVDGLSPQLVNVSWASLPSAWRDAWVGLYLEGEDPREVVPLKYKFCNASKPGSSPAGVAGSLSFRVLNYRSACVFRVFLGWDNPVLVAESPVVSLENAAAPTGVRIALTSRPDEMQVTWTGTPLPSDEVATVQYSVICPDAKGLEKAAIKASASTYDRTQLCGPPANAEGFRDPGITYSATIVGLRPGCQVTYSVGSPGLRSDDFSFRALPAPGAPVKMFVFGDMGQDPNDASAQADNDPWYTQQYAWGDPGSHNTTQAMLREHEQAPADLAFHNGDLSYAMGFSSLWEVFHDDIEQLSARLPWMVTMGNHERDWPDSGSTAGEEDSLGECGVPALRRFPMPYADSSLPPFDQPWYAMPVGCVFLIAISTEHDLSPGSSQHSFLVDALKRVDRQVTPWVVLGGHRPYYISSGWQGDQDFAQQYRDAIGELVEGHVDLIFGAHHHTYQRTCRIRRGQCAEDGLVNIIAGNGGAGLSRPNKTKPEIFEYVDARYWGYVRLRADPEHLTAEYVRSDDLQVHDAVTLTKRPSWESTSRVDAFV